MSAITFTPEQQAKWEQGIALVLHFWPALSTAIASNWGGPNGKDKRAWLAGQISELALQADVDDEYIEELLLQVMEDEFEVEVEDGSAEVTAKRVMLIRKEVKENNFSTVDKLYEVYAKKNGEEVAPPASSVQEKTEEGDEDDLDDDDEEYDDEMEDAPPQLIPAETSQRLEKIVDEDGFELVQKRGKGKK